MVACVDAPGARCVLLRCNVFQRLAGRCGCFAPLEQGLHGQAGGLHGGARTASIYASLFRSPPGLLVFLRAGVEQRFDGVPRELAVAAIIGGEIGHHRQRVCIGLAAQVRGDIFLRLVDCRPLITGVAQRPAEICGDPQYIVIEAIGGAFVDEASVGFPASIRLLLPGQPLLGTFYQLRIHVMHARHVGEFHQPIRRQDLVGGRIAEPRKSSAGNFEGQTAADIRWR